MHRHRPHRAAGPGCSPGLQGHLLTLLKPHSSLSCSNIRKDKLLHPHCLLGTGRRTRETNPAALLVYETALGKEDFVSAFLPGAGLPGQRSRAVFEVAIPALSLCCLLTESILPTLPFYSSTQALEAHTELHRLQVLTHIR